MSKLAYRPEIDGLRALSVLAVLFFHAGLGFSGGYVGVDVFFVISGFLITSLIVKDLQAGEFRFLDFWERRIRRIFPALVVMVIATLAVGAFVLLPPDFRDLANSAIAQATLTANFYFRQNAGYFDGPSELKPLLHTWSLAVEEQFYLVLPVLLVVWTKFTRRRLAGILSVLVLASFALSVWGTYAFPDKTFYLLPTRAWELLLGSLLAVSSFHIPLSPRVRSGLGWAGLAGILLASLTYTPGTLFPGLNALLPCLGGAVFIWANAPGLTSAGKLLATWPCVMIGRISYSLYLWHWPVLALLRNVYGVDLSLEMSLLAVASSFLLAWLSWKFVETPLRHSATLSRRWVFGLSTACSLLIVGVSLGIVQTDGIRNRFSAEVLEILDSGEMANRKSSSHIIPIGAELPPGQHGTFLLWGDSHAHAVSEAVHEVAAKQGVSGYIASRSGVVPVPGTWRYNHHPRKSITWNNEVVQFIKSHQIQHVILASRWAATIDALPGGSIKTLLQDKSVSTASPNASREVLRRGLANLIKEFEADGVTIWVMQQVPQQEILPTQVLTRRHLYNWSTTPQGVSLKEHQAFQARVNTVFEEFRGERFRILDPTLHCFDAAGHSRIWNENRSYYKDGDHLSRHGASELLSPLMQPVMAEISQHATIARQAREPGKLPEQGQATEVVPSPIKRVSAEEETIR